MIWLIPSNNNIYDVNNAFLELGTIDWSMDRVNYEIGDRVYIYSSIPNQRILFECQITKVNISYNESIADIKFWNDSSKRSTNDNYARFMLIHSFNDEKLGLNALMKHGLKTAPQGPLKLMNKSDLLSYIEKESINCNSLFDNNSYDSRLSKVLFCNVAPMNCYKGPEEDALLKGGKYIQEHGRGSELFNFREIDSKYYGFVQPPIGNKKTNYSTDSENKHKFATIDITKLGAEKDDQKVDGITVIWVATFKSKGRSVVGWYRNATVFRTQQDIDDIRRLYKDNKGIEETAGYYMVANVDDCVLLPMKDREKYKLPKGFGQSNIWYGNLQALSYVNNLIHNYGELGLYDKEGLRERIDRELESVPDKYKESVLKTRIGQSYFRTLILNKFNNKCALCGVEGENLLIASHIKAWKDCESGEHLDENNGLLLCPNHDKVFDSHLISFDNQGRIIISSKLSKTNTTYLNLLETYKINIDERNKKYIDFHRHIFYKENI